MLDVSLPTFKNILTYVCVQLLCRYEFIRYRCLPSALSGCDKTDCKMCVPTVHCICACVYLPTIVFAYEAGVRVGQGRGAPAVSLSGPSCVAVLPAFLLQLLEPEMHHLPAGGLETHTHTQGYSLRG